MVGATDKPRIFISWSTELSKEVALALKEWLKFVFSDATTFMSDQDIDAGTLPMDRVKRELADSSCGILVVTRDNQDRQWLNFEAGSLYRELGSSVDRVIPLLVGLGKSELRGPMGQLQIVELNEDELIQRLIPSLSHAFGVDEKVAQEIGKRFLGDLMAAVEAAKVKHSDPTDSEPQPDVPGMVMEILGIVRSMTVRRSRPTPTPEEVLRILGDVPISDAMRRNRRSAVIAQLESLGDDERAELLRRAWEAGEALKGERP